MAAAGPVPVSPLFPQPGQYSGGGAFCLSVPRGGPEGHLLSLPPPHFPVSGTCFHSSPGLPISFLSLLEDTSPDNA